MEPVTESPDVPVATGAGPEDRPTTRRRPWWPLVVALADARVYRSALSFLLLAALGFAGFIWVVVSMLVGLVLSVTLVGIPIIAVSLLGARWLGRLARGLARWGVGARIAEPGPPLRGPGLLGWIQGTLVDVVNWRAALYLVLMFPLGLLAALVTVTLAATAVLTPVLLAAPWVIRALAAANRWLAERLLAPVTLSERVRRLQASRSQVVDAAADERRRIERDLHDGAQARLVALAMDLGMARDRLARGDTPEQVATLVAEAHDELKVALEELRGLARGIHPAILTDRGLDPALSALAARCTVPVTIQSELTDRPPAAVEQIAYFCVSELLVNVSKHSKASEASVTVESRDGRLVIEVRDNGVGGADPADGTGLAGLIERVHAVDGTLHLDSPRGGPTVVRVELPCAS